MGPKLNCRGAMGVLIMANVLMGTASHAPRRQYATLNNFASAAESRVTQTCLRLTTTVPSALFTTSSYDS